MGLHQEHETTPDCTYEAASQFKMMAQRQDPRATQCQSSFSSCVANHFASHGECNMPSTPSKGDTDSVAMEVAGSDMKVELFNQCLAVRLGPNCSNTIPKGRAMEVDVRL
eukprot:4475081-Amphidinium_carterae.1